MTAHRSLILAVFLTLAPLVGGSVVAAPVVDFTGGAITSNGGDSTFGWSFTVASPIAVEGLGLFDIGKDGLADSHQIGLWTGGGILLTSTTITTANSTPFASTSTGGIGYTGGEWRSTPITPLVLIPGEYVVGAFYTGTSPDDFISIWNPEPYPGTVSTVPGVTFDRPRYALESSLAFPANDDSPFVTAGYFGPNLFTVATPPVPEPETYAMLMAGLGLLSFMARRRGKSLNAAA